MTGLKVSVKATDGSKALRFRVHAITIDVSHAFGDDARYKGRNQEPRLEIESENFAIYVEPDSGDFSDVDPAEVLRAVIDPVIRGCEIVVQDALEREKEALDKKLEQVGQKSVKL